MLASIVKIGSKFLRSPLQANKKTRNRAYDILVQIGHACGDEEKGGSRENLYQFFNMVNIDFKFLSGLHLH